MKLDLLFSLILALLTIALILANLSFSVHPYGIDLVYAAQDDQGQAQAHEPSTFLVICIGIAGLFAFWLLRNKVKK
jgi:hypothetical protein